MICAQGGTAESVIAFQSRRRQGEVCHAQTGRARRANAEFVSVEEDASAAVVATPTNPLRVISGFMGALLHYSFSLW